MAVVSHVKCIVHGKYKLATLAGEEWQFGVDLAPIIGSTFDDIWTVNPNFDVSYEASTVTGSGYTGESNVLLEGGTDDIDLLNWLESNVMPAAIAYIGRAGLFPTDVYIDEISAAPYGQDGKVCQLPVGAAYATITATGTTWDGAETGVAMAPFTSYAISKETIANVPRGRGRFFPPHIVASASMSAADGLMPSGGRTAYVQGAQEYLQGIQLDAGAGNVSMWPIVIGAPFTTAYKITAVSVDNIPDTQRRRKYSLAPARTRQALTY